MSSDRPYFRYDQKEGVTDVYKELSTSDSEEDISTDENGVESMMAVQVFFPAKQSLDTGLNCTNLISRERLIPQTQAVAQASMEQLFQGPTQEEQAMGLSAAFLSEVAINSIQVDSNGYGLIDLGNISLSDVADTCIRDALRAQVSATFEQFPTVDRALVSVNGDPDFLFGYQDPSGGY